MTVPLRLAALCAYAFLVGVGADAGWASFAIALAGITAVVVIAAAAEDRRQQEARFKAEMRARYGQAWRS